MSLTTISRDFELPIYSGEPPWTGCGGPILKGVTTAAALAAVDLNWKSVPHQLYYDVEGSVRSSNMAALLRSDNLELLSEVPTSFRPMQPKDCFEFCQRFSAVGADLHAAGHFKRGKITWFMMRLRDAVTILNGDTIEARLLFTAHHEFGASPKIHTLMMRKVNYASFYPGAYEDVKKPKDDAVMRVKDLEEFDVSEMRHLVTQAKQTLQLVKVAAEWLGSKYYNEESLYDFFCSVFPVKTEKGKMPTVKETSSTASHAFSYIDRQPGAHFAPGTWWHAVNMVWHMIDGVVGQTPDTRMINAWYGPGMKQKQQALQMAMEFATIS